ncbi:type I-E CRISPR-associated protein Cse1/CasA [Xylocopilactobacillus apicola]|uniref:CRISPR-associated protein n=1 Tax=Xylocopilactobacillus apicola TaxID=2932184 RepID=A0AAU9D2G6_9LACO|nr:type I-E CRISPR-associated protein Cse1/CasA [Xylocopilactobacillus apicola]BDR58971.1 CRISPR-associated protein [Xylocopilactobacillus apicola]
MNNKQFNLTTDPWIKVIDSDSKTCEVSLIDFFENANNYRQLAGEMRSQDLAIMRFLLAILHTVYSRFSNENRPYEWLEIDPDNFQVLNSTIDYDEEDLLDTWESLFQNGQFTSVVIDYLKHNQDKFDVFGEHPFYQVSKEDYDSLVLEKYKIEKGTGTVAIKQMNRQISESNNTPDLFSPKISDFKNELDMPELVRWLISYQNYTGVTDKAKVETSEKFSSPSGWLYKLNPVYVKGKNLFETLMLNLVFDDEEYHIERPIWECTDIKEYVKWRKKELLPDNRAALYTSWSRLIHIEWSSDGVPTIYSAGVPMYSPDNAFDIEPMSTWRKKSKKEPDIYVPAVKNKDYMDVAMWRNFGDYVNPNKSNETHRPGIVSWLSRLKGDGMIDRSLPVSLVSVSLVSDGNATSQSPFAEISDDLTMRLDVIFDDKQDFWPRRIEDTIDLTQDVAKSYWKFSDNLSKIRSLDSKEFNKKQMSKFYDRLNLPFKEWLASLSDHDDRDLKINEWKETLWDIVNSEVKEFMKNSSPRDITGIEEDNNKSLNIFIARNRLLGSVLNKLGIKG